MTMNPRLWRTTTAALILTALAGCQSKTQIPTQQQSEHAISPAVLEREIERWSRRTVAPLALRPGASNEAQAFVPPTDKLYFFGPYEDPVDPSLLHGDHVVVRREQDSRPLLFSAAARRTVIGNVADGRVNHMPAALPRELAEELIRSRQINTRSQAAVTALQEEARALRIAAAELTTQTAELKAARLREIERVNGPKTEKQGAPEESRG